MNEARQMPPFAKRAAPMEGWLWVYCGSRAWKMVQQHLHNGISSELIFPADKSPSTYRWPVRDLIVGVHGLNAPVDQVADLVIELMRCGALDVYLFDERLVTDGALFHHYSRKDYLDACERAPAA